MRSANRPVSEDRPAEKKPVRWMGSSRKDLTEMPEDIQDAFGKALLQAQFGGRAASTKIMQGFGGATVLEIREDEDGSTYRLVYTVRFPRYVYALHVFQKKSRHGAETPRQDIDLIHTRLAAADADYQELTAAEQAQAPGSVTPDREIKRKPHGKRDG
ncbi:MAG: type II toxin-antitoxin system RelE/ParE family toxin [Armatimonadetes bacterium]|nr:type II toxin-antitoxin system RelE/ParE family toxin [Armatimonadota bacterium]